MTLPKCHLANTINLVVWPTDWNKSLEEYPKVLPAVMEQLQRDLTRLSSTTGIPVVMEYFPDGTPRLVFCTERYDVGCVLTEMGDAYKFLFSAPLSFRRCNQLAHQAIAVIIDNHIPWRIHTSFQGLKTVSNQQSGFEEIKTAWERANPENIHQKTEKLSPDHFKFLNDIENLIDMASDIELDNQEKESVVVQNFSSVPEERYSRSVYKFQVQDHNFKVGDYVLVDCGVPGERDAGYTGSITRVSKNSLTISFNQPVDVRLLDSVQWIKPFTSLRQYQIQRSALRALREGSSANPYLFNIIVNGDFASQKSPMEKMPPFEQFNASQSLAIGYASQVEDLLLIIGPPGTGKTKSIAEISRRHAQLGKRVLITSKNNKAVDNALQKIAEVANLDILRIGREEAISDDVNHLKIDVRALNLQERILTRTEPTWEKWKLAAKLWPQIEIALAELEIISTHWQSSIENYETENQKLTAWEDEVYLSYQPILTRLQNVVNRKEKQLTQINTEIDSATAKINFGSAFARFPLIGTLIKRSNERNTSKIEDYKARRDQIVQQKDNTWQDKQRIFESYKQHISFSAEAQRRKKLVDIALKKKKTQETENRDFLKRLGQVLSRFSEAPQINQVDSPHRVSEFIKELRFWYQKVQVKHALLGDWRNLLSTRHQALYPSLIRMADVVGATCIGIATDARFEDLEFDLAIADEAGQIQVMDLLVPLVRTRRVILVGDHKQLPPIVSEEIKERLNPENTDQKEWLEKSLFEHIVNQEKRPSDRMVMLDTQYRIPPIIAEFISTEFYENRYKTGHEFTHSDPFFDSPMVFVDTCRSPNRHETRKKGDSGRGASYSNHLEASLIAELVNAYNSYEYEWGVIVPYKKQAELIQQKLKDQVPPEILNDWVATVDSFQGKERKIIIYGFTRSNNFGQIGFMRELRRLNVSLTRACNQLIMVGNADFLTTTSDKDFSFLMSKLLGVARTTKGSYIHANQLGNIISPRKISL